MKREKFTEMYLFWRNFDHSVYIVFMYVCVPCSSSLSFSIVSGLALDELINQSFTGVFMHRYKDTRPILREESMASLGQWIGVYPERLFDAHYLK